MTELYLTKYKQSDCDNNNPFVLLQTGLICTFAIILNYINLYLPKPVKFSII